MQSFLSCVEYHNHQIFEMILLETCLECIGILEV